MSHTQQLLVQVYLKSARILGSLLPCEHMITVQTHVDVSIRNERHLLALLREPPPAPVPPTGQNFELPRHGAELDETDAGKPTEPSSPHARWRDRTGTHPGPSLRRPRMPLVAAVSCGRVKKKIFDRKGSFVLTKRLRKAADTYDR
jgi:hypothetical protein